MLIGDKLIRGYLEEVFVEGFKETRTKVVEETVQEFLSNIDKALEARKMSPKEAASMRQRLAKYREERLANVDEIAHKAFCEYLEKRLQQPDRLYC
ncbi:MAG: hypothetical protein IJ667_10690 [Synergistaceae bacterium]|nr:hypothetical protein [Synergistaceae bacterium]